MPIKSSRRILKTKFNKSVCLVLTFGAMRGKWRSTRHTWTELRQYLLLVSWTLSRITSHQHVVPFGWPINEGNKWGALERSILIDQLEVCTHIMQTPRRKPSWQTRTQCSRWTDQSLCGRTSTTGANGPSARACRFG